MKMKKRVLRKRRVVRSDSMGVSENKKISNFWIALAIILLIIALIAFAYLIYTSIPSFMTGNVVDESSVPVVYQDVNGNYIDQYGNPVDPNGNPLSDDSNPIIGGSSDNPLLSLGLPSDLSSIGQGFFDNEMDYDLMLGGSMVIVLGLITFWMLTVLYTKFNKSLRSGRIVFAIFSNLIVIFLLVLPVYLGLFVFGSISDFSWLKYVSRLFLWPLFLNVSWIYKLLLFVVWHHVFLVVSLLVRYANRSLFRMQRVSEAEEIRKGINVMSRLGGSDI